MNDDTERAPLYPEHERFQAVRRGSDTLVEFLEWLIGTGGKRARPHYDDGNAVPLETLTEAQKERLIMDYYEIDYDAFYEEKEAMVHAMADQQKGLT